MPWRHLVILSRHSPRDRTAGEDIPSLRLHTSPPHPPLQLGNSCFRARHGTKCPYFFSLDPL